MDWIGDWYADDDVYIVMSVSVSPSVPPRIVTTLLFQAYTIKWVIVLIVLYAGIMLLYSVTTIHVMSLSVLYVGCDL